MDRSCWWATAQGVTKSQTRLKLLTMHAPVYTYCMLSCLVPSNSLPPHELEPTGLLCPWNFPGKNIGVGCHFLLQGILLTEGGIKAVSPASPAFAPLALCHLRSIHLLEQLKYDK